ncbi:aminotransferase class I/II-fold pyridoxal phosphate-dependent enzyme [Ornithinimicrobium flavum]|uniref:aminotransferase class I/II-fold pyridoxal phosphate-dependent enzyme n=1 Tax=Ornithinimicrobium flavum TaxID=1288636 RepID=UPI0010700935|nr:aminotransferase class I/II-fold pyridoxal phosphate-dependent enzyme [Ornithinimicrobium flavum]
MPPSDLFVPQVASPEVPPAGTHGGDGPAVEAALGLAPGSLLDLSQNMNPVAPPVAPVVSRHLSALGHYPDDREARRVLAEALGVDPGRVLLTNGGSEAIHLVTTVLGGRVREEPEFGLHPRGSEGPVWRTDPHSPTGRLADPEERADVWDEAFYALATGRWTALGTPARDRVVVVGSLTKTFSCPGLRLGYVVVPERPVVAPDGTSLDPEDLRARLLQAQPHWPVSALALAALPDLLAEADLPGWSARIRQLRRELVSILEGVGLQVQTADAPWVLLHEPGLRERLAPRGVLVRDCASFGLPGVARMAVPDSPGLDRVATALARA